MNRRATIASLGALLFSAGAAVGISRLTPQNPRSSGDLRLVSLSPAITETLLALGASQQLVAVSDYCSLPATLKLARVGSSLTPSYEAIAALRASHVLCDDSAGAKQRELAAIAKCEIFPWLTLSDVVASTRRLGKLVARDVLGNALAQQLDSRLSQLPPPAAPRVLLLLSYDPDRPAELWFIKRNSLHGAALSAAGARNAVERDVPGLPRLGVEELIQLDPDQVFILPPPGATLAHKRQMLSAFGALAPLRAVQSNRLAIVNGTQAVGPSILKLADALSNMLKRMAEPRPPGGIVE